MKYIPLVILILLPAILFAQLNVSFSGIAGSYKMEELKNLQSQFGAQLVVEGIQLERVLDFPASLQGELGLNYEKGGQTYGAFLNHAITGGKDQYKDYSGEVFAEQKMSRVLLGLRFSQEIAKGFKINAKAGYNISHLNLAFATHIYGGGSEVERLYFNSLGASFEPGLRWDYSYRRFLFNALAAYEWNFQGNTYRNRNKDVYLQDLNGQKVKMDWSGYRLGLGVGFVF